MRLRDYPSIRRLMAPTLSLSVATKVSRRQEKPTPRTSQDLDGLVAFLIRMSCTVLGASSGRTLLSMGWIEVEYFEADGLHHTV